MTTPYGTSIFSSTDNTDVLEADIQNPLGQFERVEYREWMDPATVPASETNVPSGTGTGLPANVLTIANSGLNTCNTFYWGRRAMADIGNGTPSSASDYAAAGRHPLGAGHGKQHRLHRRAAEHEEASGRARLVQLSQPKRGRHPGRAPVPL